RRLLPVDSRVVEPTEVVFELRPPLREMTKDAKVRTSLERSHVQEDISSFDVLRTLRLIEIELLPMVIAREKRGRQIVTLWIEVVRGGKPPRLDRQGIVIRQSGQYIGRQGQSANRASQFVTQLAAPLAGLGISAASYVTNHQKIEQGPQIALE